MNPDPSIAMSEQTQLIMLVIGAIQTIALAFIAAWSKRTKTDMSQTKAAVAETNIAVSEMKPKVDAAAADIAEQRAGMQEQRANIGSLMEAELARSAGPGSMLALNADATDAHAEILRCQQRIAELRQLDLKKTIAQQAAEYAATLAKKEGLGQGQGDKQP